MIVSEQERDALMAAIQTYASACANVIGALENGNDKEAEKWEELADTEMDVIRAMLAPTDDAVIRDAVREALALSTLYTGRFDDIPACAGRRHAMSERPTLTISVPCPNCKGKGVVTTRIRIYDCDGEATGPCPDCTDGTIRQAVGCESCRWIDSTQSVCEHPDLGFLTIAPDWGCLSWEAKA